jgi:hypothetical protein
MLRALQRFTNRKRAKMTVTRKSETVLKEVHQLPTGKGGQLFRRTPEGHVAMSIAVAAQTAMGLERATGSDAFALGPFQNLPPLTPEVKAALLAEFKVSHSNLAKCEAAIEATEVQS